MTDPSETTTLHSVYEREQIARSQKLRACIEELARRYEQDSLASTYGPNSAHTLSLSFATGTYSKHWHTTSLLWGSFLKILDAGIETKNKDGIILCPGTLTAGRSLEGTRKLKANVECLHLLIYDFDKGDATLDVLTHRMRELGIECAIYPTFSNLKDRTKLSWSVTRQSPKTGETETVPSAFQLFAKERLGIGSRDTLDANIVTAEVALAFMLEQQEFDAEVLGDVTITDLDKVENPQDHVITTCVVVKHKPLAKTRLVILLAAPVARGKGETAGAFQTRWTDEIYSPIGRLIGFKFDPQCASTERGHYAMMRKSGTEKIPLRHIAGQPIDLTAPDIERLLLSHRSTPAERPVRSRQRRGVTSPASQPAKEPEWSSRIWLGFQAADAAADHLPSVTDKRTDPAGPLVAFPCPFVCEHATSNNPSAHQAYAYNALRCDLEPTVKCQSATCKDRPSSEFLEAVFSSDVRKDAHYRLECAAQMTGCLVTENELDDVLSEINKSWAVVRAGGRTRYLHERPDGDFELYDNKSVNTWFANWKVLKIPKEGKPKEEPLFPYWNAWEHRRQYHGIRFSPNPNEIENGIYNTYRGFKIEPRKGSWKLLQGHIYRNICQRNPAYFRFLIAWLAQLVQQPHIKPGTNIVLKGKEGVGKSKLGECIVRLLGIHALVVSESERITGRFNAHLENKIFMMAEEAFWAGDKAAEGKLKDLATGSFMSYERKGLDPYEGKNYTRIMIASNEEWVVPASSGGRRWFVLEVGDECQKDHAFFAAIDQEMNSGGLEAMLYDLLQSKLPEQVNVRSAPITPWLIEQRRHSYDNRMRWLRGVLLEGGFRNNDTSNFVALDELQPTIVGREDVFASARKYFAGPKGVDPTPAEIGQFLVKKFGKLESRKLRTGEGRRNCTIFPSLKEMRERWYEFTGEDIRQTSQDDEKPETGAMSDFASDEFSSARDAIVYDLRSLSMQEDFDFHGFNKRLGDARSITPRPNSN